MYSLYKGGPGFLPRKILENLECRKKPSTTFLGLFFIFFIFYLISFLYSFLVFFKISRLFFIF